MMIPVSGQRQELPWTRPMQGGSEVNAPTARQQFLCNHGSFDIKIAGFMGERFIDNPLKFL